MHPFSWCHQCTYVIQRVNEPPVHAIITMNDLWLFLLAIKAHIEKLLKDKQYDYQNTPTKSPCKLLYHYHLTSPSQGIDKSKATQVGFRSQPLKGATLDHGIALCVASRPRPFELKKKVVSSHWRHLSLVLAHVGDLPKAEVSVHLSSKC